MNAALPFVSVIVPAYDRPESLKTLLGALVEQSYPPYRFEVLVCDDGSTPPLAERVGLKDAPFSLRFLRAENAGPATARNRGVKEARGTLLAFTDDDCLPDPGWLEAIVEAFANPQVQAVHGPTHSAIPPIDPFVHSLDVRQQHGVATANFAVRKEAIAAVGGFDETFGAPYYEDEDLSRRLQARYGPIAYAEAMRVEHPPRLAPFARAWRTARFYRYLHYMQRKHPGYAAGAQRALLRRVAAKSVLVVIGLLPLVGAPGSFALAWVALFAWQLKRLQRVLKQAVQHGVRVPLADQGQFLFLEWLLDYVRLAAYRQGRSLQAKPPAPEELEIG